MLNRNTQLHWIYALSLILLSLPYSSLSYTLYRRPHFYYCHLVFNKRTLAEQWGIERVVRCCLNSTLWWSPVVSINSDKNFIEIDLYFSWHAAGQATSGGTREEKQASDHIEIYIITKASDKKAACCFVYWQNGLFYFFLFLFFLKKRRDMQNARNHIIRILYIFYIDWAGRTGIRIELFMFVGVVIFFSLHEHLVFMCIYK